MPNTARNQDIEILDTHKPADQLDAQPIGLGTPKFNNAGFELNNPYAEQKESKKRQKVREFYALENYRSESYNYHDSKSYSTP